jgi:hypothetical protein
MATRLFAVANATDKPASLSSTEHPDTDDCPIPALEVTHTGGKDGDFIRVPDCSDSTYWREHHITIAADDGSWAISIWDDDDSNHVLQWSPADEYSTGHTCPGSDAYTDFAILIETSSDPPNHPTVHCSQWD